MSALTMVRELAAQRRTSTEELRDAILEARSQGSTLGQIAQAAGVTKQRISQIVNGKERATR